MEQVMVDKAFYGADGKAEIKKIDITPMTVRYPGGFETVMKKYVAEVEQKRGKLEIIGPATVKPAPEKKGKKIDRAALIKEAIAAGLGTKEDFVKVSDSELAALVGEK